MRSIALPLALIVLGPAGAQHTDTLRYYSAAFGAQREVLVHLPEFHRYAAPEVGMPVIILLDGQHDWFVEPLLNDIRYLQYTHEVPQAIVVTIPLVDRVQECAPDSINQPATPLLRLLKEELPPLIAPYHPGELTVLVGHSFSASFALYAYLQAPGALDAVIALSPLHQVKQSLPRVMDRLTDHVDERVWVAVGGVEPTKDGGHYDALVNAMKAADPPRAGGRFHFGEYPSAGHTSLPIIAFPELVTSYFGPYSMRDTLAPVDQEYQLRAAPPEPDVLVNELRSTWHFMGTTLAGDLAELNGILSRLSNSGYLAHVEAVSRLGISLYPAYFGFYAWLGEALKESDPERARTALHRALELLEEHERSTADYADAKAEIEELLK